MKLLGKRTASRATALFTLTAVFLLICWIALLSGCSGGGGSGNRNTTNQNASLVVSQSALSYDGRATTRLIWPPRTEASGRLIPTGAYSVVVEIIGLPEGSTTFRQVLPRPEPVSPTDPTLAPTTCTFTGLPVGIPLTVRAGAFPNADGTGTEQASAQLPVVFQAGDNAYTLTLVPTVTQITFAELGPLFVQVGDQLSIQATARNGNGEVVLIGPGKLIYSGSNESGTVDALTGQVQTSVPGTLTVTATYEEAAPGATPISAQVVVNVVPVPTPSPAPTPSGPPQYKLIDLGSIPLGAYDWASSINANRAITGSIFKNGAYRAFRINAGETSLSTATDLGVSGGLKEASGVAINDAGQVLINAYTIISRNPEGTGDVRTTRGFIVPPGGDASTAFDLGAGTVPVALNNAGQVAGYYSINNTVRGFRLDAGQTFSAQADIGSLGGQFTNVYAMNDLGQVVGSSSISTVNGDRYALYRTQPNAQIAATDIISRAEGNPYFSINRSGQTVGSTVDAGRLKYARTTATGTFSDGTATAIPLSGDLRDIQSVNGINDNGDVVGSASGAAFYGNHGYIFTGGLTYDLNDITPNRTGTIVRAAAINASGDVVGTMLIGVDTGFYHAVLLIREGNNRATPIRQSGKR